MESLSGPVVFVLIIVALVWVVKIVYDWLEKQRTS
jgi:hypothetical protein